MFAELGETSLCKGVNNIKQKLNYQINFIEKNGKYSILLFAL